MNASSIRRALTGLAAITAVSMGGVLATTGTAQAATTLGLCTVNPLTPIIDGENEFGIHIVRYRIAVKCAGDRSVNIQQKMYEEDDGPDDRLGDLVRHTFEPGLTAGSTTLDTRRTVPETDTAVGDDTEELYHQVRFRVT